MFLNDKKYIAMLGLTSVLLSGNAFGAACNVSGAPSGVLYMTFDAQVTSNTAIKNGEVSCGGASLENKTCLNVGDKHIQGLMLKGAKTPVSFSGWAGGGGQSGSLKIEYEVCKNGIVVPMPRGRGSLVYGWPMG